MLTVLSHAYFCTEASLAQKTGMPTDTIWQHMQDFKQKGLPVIYRKKQGFRLLYPIEWLDPQRILKALSPHIQNQLKTLDVFISIPSTNTYLLKSDISGHACFAEHQTQGRGRRGKTWNSPLCGNLYGSLRWHFSKIIPELSGLSLVAGLAVLDTLQAYGVSGLSLKWPNDVWLHGRKLGGILVEFSGDQKGGTTELIIGVGIDATECCEQPIKRNTLAAWLLETLCRYCIQFETFGFSYFQKKWEPYDALAGKKIILTADHQMIEGIAEGVNGQGALLLREGLKQRAYHAGEVSIRSISA